MYTNEDRKQFCKNITALRRIHGLSKARMASVLGISVRSLEKIEAGEIPCRMSFQILISINYHFGIMPNELFKTSIISDK